MKKIITSLFVVFLLMFAVPVGVFADNDTTEEDTVSVTNETHDRVGEGDRPPKRIPKERISAVKADRDMMNETKEPRGFGGGLSEKHVEEVKEDIKNKKHAEFKIIQLKEALDLNIQSGNLIVAELDAKGSNVSEDASLIVGKLEVLLDDANAVNLTQDKEAVKLEFDLISEQAKELTKEFKDLVKDELTDEEKENIRDLIKEVKVDNKEAYKAEREAKKVELYVDQVRDFMERMGLDETIIAGVIAKIESGEISTEQIKSSVKRFYNSMDDNQKKELVAKYKEDRTKRSIESREMDEERKAEFEEKRDELRMKQEEKEFELRAKHDERMAEFKAEHEEKLAELEEKRLERFNEMKERHDIEMEDESEDNENETENEVETESEDDNEESK